MYIVNKRICPTHFPALLQAWLNQCGSQVSQQIFRLFGVSERTHARRMSRQQSRFMAIVFQEPNSIVQTDVSALTKEYCPAVLH